MNEKALDDLATSIATEIEEYCDSCYSHPATLQPEHKDSKTWVGLYGIVSDCIDKVTKQLQQKQVDNGTP